MKRNFSQYHIFPTQIFFLNVAFVLQLTGVLIGAAVAVSLIGIVVLFLYRRFKLSRESFLTSCCCHQSIQEVTTLPSQIQTENLTNYDECSTKCHMIRHRHDMNVSYWLLPTV